MRRSNEKSSVYNSGRGITGQTLLYQHMSNHYRRILNAKKVIDTTPPGTYKAKSNSSCSRTSSTTRSFITANKILMSRNISPVFTERTASAISNVVSYWGTESYEVKKYHIPRKHKCSCSATSDINVKGSDIEVAHFAFDTKHESINGSKSIWKAAESGAKINIKSPYETKSIRNRNGIMSSTKKSNGNKGKIAPVKRKMSVKDKSPSDLLEKHNKCFISHSNSFCPRILKTNASSKVKNLKVYHPPRKKIGGKSISNWKEREEDEIKLSDDNVEVIRPKCGEISACQNGRCKTIKCERTLKTRETTQTSSRDSAYNGGVSSLPESRSPTPDQGKQTNLLCPCHRKENNTYYNNVATRNGNIIVPTLKLTDNQDTQTEITNISERETVNTNPPVNNANEHVSRSKQKTGKEQIYFIRQVPLDTDEEKIVLKRKIKEEALYTTFIRNITTEVLEKGLYTNKALKKVMKRHMISNLWLLDKDRMLQEVDKLRIQLGIPEDKNLMNIKVVATGSSEEMEEQYSLISDSELIEPNADQKKGKKKKDNSFNYKEVELSDTSDSEKPFAKSISAILNQNHKNSDIVLDSESDNEDEISVIQVTKLLKEKQMHNSVMRDLSSDLSRNVTQSNSADESELSSDHMRKKKKSHKFRKAGNNSSSSGDQETATHNPDSNQRHYGRKTENQTKSLASPKKREKKELNTEIKGDENSED